MFKKRGTILSGWYAIYTHVNHRYLFLFQKNPQLEVGIKKTPEVNFENTSEMIHLSNSPDIFILMEVHT